MVSDYSAKVARSHPFFCTTRFRSIDARFASARSENVINACCQSDVFHGNESSRSRSSETEPFYRWPANRNLNRVNVKRLIAELCLVFSPWISDEIDHYVDIQANRVIRKRVIKVFPLWNYYIAGKKRRRKNVYSLVLEVGRKQLMLNGNCVASHRTTWNSLGESIVFEFTCSLITRHFLFFFFFFLEFRPFFE